MATLNQLSMTSSSSETMPILPPQANLCRSAHGIIMSICFVVLLPLFAITLYLVPSSKTVSRIHGPLQLISLALVIIGLGLGVYVFDNLTAAVDPVHHVVGYVVVGYLVLVQPALGILQHGYFKRHGESSGYGVTHRWLGRGFLALGIVDGALGLQVAQAKTGYVMLYGVVTAVVAVFYIAVVLVKVFIRRRRTEEEKQFACEMESVESL